MRNVFVLVFGLFLATSVSGCGSSSPAASGNSQSGTSEGELSTRELTAALGIRYWRYKVPADIGDQQIAIRVKGGPTPTITGGIEADPGEVVTICVRSLLANNAMECTLVTEKGYSRSMINNAFLQCRSVGHTPNGSMIGEEPMIKGNLEGQVSMTGTAPGDVSLLMTTQEVEAIPPGESGQPADGGEPPAMPEQ